MPNAWGDTTLRRAVSTHYPNLAHIKQLLQKGAKTDIKDKKGKTSAEAVQEAIEWGVVRNGHFIISTELCDDARLAYAEALKLFFLPQHLWPKRSFFRKILDLF
jgi:hypothetical protein